MCVQVPQSLLRSCKDFCANDAGGITAFTAMIFSFMLLAFGMGVDFMRHETYRAELQNAVDRGLLAAAATDQTIGAEDTLRAYMKSTNFVNENYSLAVQQTTQSGMRRVNATASYQVPTYFLKLVGIPHLNVAAAGSALEGRDSVEISLALDISGSMRFNSRLPNLQSAATAFVDQILTAPEDTTSINVVPYAGQVNPGATLFNAMGGNRTHTYSSCLEFTSGDFDHAGLPSGYHDQVPNFHYWNTDTNWMDWGWCPEDDTSIVVASQDATAIKSMINNIRLHDGTGTQNAMKYALALLNPTSNSAFSTLSTNGEIDSAFSDRPHAWGAANGLKVIVLMTDGQITDQWRPQNGSDPDLATEEVKPHGHPKYKKTSRSANLTRFYDMCDDAKTNGVIVFTIALEAPSGAQTEMRNCATSDAHYYDVNGGGLANAFSSIAATIQKLKLVE